MNNEFEKFPTLSQEAIQKMNINLSMFAKYKNENDEFELQITPEEDNEYIYMVDDPLGKWTPKENNIRLFGELTIENTNCLFEEYQIANTDSILGIAITYNSKETSKTITKTIGEITYQENNLKTSFEFNKEFYKGELALKLNIAIILYVKEIKQESNIFANKIGTVLGTLLEKDIILEGNGSIFPIEIVEDKDGPLWDMMVEYNDLTDNFSLDTISLDINSLHPNFKYLQTDKITSKNSTLWKEILASFFENLILAIDERDGIENFINEESFEEGTIAASIKYIISEFEIDIIEIKKPILLLKKIRKKLDELIK